MSEIKHAFAPDWSRKGQKLQAFMTVAEMIGTLGTCDRKQVGAVIIRDGRCISWGFNGAPSGLLHCDENMHGYLSQWREIVQSCRRDGMSETEAEDWADDRLKYEVGNGCKNATHAEANALAAAAKQGISTDGATLFVTLSPCETCARLIIAAGIIRVYYAEEYRKDDGCQLLQRASIESLQLSSPRSTT
jgi:dCMP deaminase